MTKEERQCKALLRHVVRSCNMTIIKVDDGGQYDYAEGYVDALIDVIYSIAGFYGVSTSDFDIKDYLNDKEDNTTEVGISISSEELGL